MKTAEELFVALFFAGMVIFTVLLVLHEGSV